MALTLNHNPVALFYSPKDAAQFGAKVANVPDREKGGRREIVYTHMTPKLDGSDYIRDDKTFIWKGPESDIRPVSFRAPIKGNAPK